MKKWKTYGSIVIVAILITFAYGGVRSYIWGNLYCGVQGKTWYPGDTGGPTRSDAYCAKKYPDGGNSCTSSSQCAGGCYVRRQTSKANTMHLPIIGTCRKNDGPTSPPGCVDKIENVDPTKDNFCVEDFE